MEQEIQTYAEVSTENEGYNEDFTFGDIMFITVTILIGCFIIGFIFRQIKSTFKNVHLKVGNKFEVGVETKEDNPSDKKKIEENKKEEDKKE